MSDGIGKMLATESGPDPSDRGDYAETNYRQLAETSLRAAHEAMQRGQYSEACNHMSDWAQHNSRSDYNQPSPGQRDRDGDDDASGLVIVPPRRPGG